MAMTARLQLVEALRKVRERVAHGYPSLEAAQSHLLIGYAKAPLSTEARVQLETRLARARAAFDLRQLLPARVVEQATGIFWQDTDAKPLTRAQTLVLLDDLILEAQRPPLPDFGPLFQSLH